MLNSPTLDKLHTLRLTAMAATRQEQQRSAEAQALAFDDRLGLLVDAEFVAVADTPPCRDSATA